MSKQKNKHDEPWSKRFGEDEKLSTRQYSRSARHANNNEVAPLYKVLLFLFLALLIIPFGTIYWSRHTRNTPEPMTSDQVMVNKQITSSIAGAEAEANAVESGEVRRSNDSSKVEKVESSSEEKPQESTAQESQPEETVPEPESEEAPQEAEQSLPQEEEAETETEPAEGSYGNTYTVKAGDNLYRIALNHGMTLEELKAANGLSSDVAEIGTVLKVK